NVKATISRAGGGATIRYWVANLLGSERTTRQRELSFALCVIDAHHHGVCLDLCGCGSDADWNRVARLPVRDVGVRPLPPFSGAPPRDQDAFFLPYAPAEGSRLEPQRVTRRVAFR